MKNGGKLYCHGQSKSPAILNLSPPELVLRSLSESASDPGNEVGSECFECFGSGWPALHPNYWSVFSSDAAQTDTKLKSWTRPADRHTPAKRRHLPNKQNLREGCEKDQEEIAVKMLQVRLLGLGPNQEISQSPHSTPLLHPTPPQFVSRPIAFASVLRQNLPQKFLLVGRTNQRPRSRKSHIPHCHIWHYWAWVL